MLVLLLLLGAFLLVALNLNKAYARKDFTWKKFIQKNVVGTIVNLIVGFIFILSKDDLANIFPITKISIAMVGFAGGALWNYVFGILTPDKETVVGMNKKQ